MILRLRRLRFASPGLLLGLGVFVLSAAGEVRIVTAPAASPLELLAAEELQRLLPILYPTETFSRRRDGWAQGPTILVGTSGSLPRELLAPPNGLPTRPEAYRISRFATATAEGAVIAGADPRGVLQAVYGLYQHLGGAFTLTEELPPPPRPDLDFAAWSLTNAPLVGERVVFNWHNFLSGCTTWNLAEWRQWIEQSQKLGFNTIMVHAYANNPMAHYRFQGRDKPVGYLATTRHGRDWATMHVNDVRRLVGGDLFDGPVFGADAARVPDDERVRTAQALMAAVFEHAAARGVRTTFALDVDTAAANPAELIGLLPPHARFAVAAPAGAGRTETVWLADPDTPEGEAFYRAQVTGLLSVYPTLDTLVVWFRKSGTPWLEYREEEMPARWREEFQAAVAAAPAVAGHWRARHLFGLAKVVRAWQRAVQATGRPVEVALGTWDFEFLPAADHFLPKDVKLIGLDYAILHGRAQLDAEAGREQLRAVGQHRPVVPVLWAHHDDGHYFGRPYAPVARLADQLAASGSAGYGIIHWMTRPLDLAFVSHARQVWQATANESLVATLRHLAGAWFGPAAREAGATYLQRWITDAPMYGRETSDMFVTDRLPPSAPVVAGVQARLRDLPAPPPGAWPAEAPVRVDYFRALEQFGQDVHVIEEAYHQSRDRLAEGDLAAARATIRGHDPERAVQDLARAVAAARPTRGELGLIVTLNTRWLPHFRRHRQELGLEPVRVNFATTSHEPLAQSPGLFTFHVDPAGEVWECAGTRETGAEIFHDGSRLNPAAHDAVGAELAREGIASGRSITWRIRPGPGGDYQRTEDELPKNPPGNYQLELWVPAGNGANGSVEIALGDGRTALLPPQPLSAAPSSSTDAPVRVHRLAFTLERPGPVLLTLTPLEGEVRLCALVLRRTD